MSGRHQELRRNEYWLRCPYCGDSDSNPNQAKFSINVLNGKYHCHKCNVGGKYTSADLLPLVLDYYDTLVLEDIGEGKEVKEDQIVVLPGPGLPRDSYLDRYHTQDRKGNLVDIFKCRSLSDKEDDIGLYFRYKDRRSRIQGKRAFGYSDKLNLLRPLRIVEGPYDCLGPQDVCLFGFPSHLHVRDLGGLTLVLCPDGDVWKDIELLLRFFSPFLRNNTANIEWVEVLPNGLDPDEVPIHERRLVPYNPLRLKLDSIIKQRRLLNVPKYRSVPF